MVLQGGLEARWKRGARMGLVPVEGDETFDGAGGVGGGMGMWVKGPRALGNRIDMVCFGGGMPSMVSGGGGLGN